MNKILIAAASLATVAAAISSVQAAPDFGQSLNTLNPAVAKAAEPENSRQMADAVWNDQKMPAIPANISDPAGGHFRIPAAVKPHIVKQQVAEFTHVKRPGFLTAQGFIKVPRDPEVAGLEQMARLDAKANKASSQGLASTGLVLVSSGSKDANGVNATWRVYEAKAKDGSILQLTEYRATTDRDVVARDVAGYSSKAYFQELSKIDEGDKTPASQQQATLQLVPVAVVWSAHATAAKDCAALDARLDREHVAAKIEQAKLAKAGCKS